MITDILAMLFFIIGFIGISYLFYHFGYEEGHNDGYTEGRFDAKKFNDNPFKHKDYDRRRKTEAD